jgi:hypothetical protein
VLGKLAGRVSIPDLGGLCIVKSHLTATQTNEQKVYIYFHFGGTLRTFILFLHLTRKAFFICKDSIFSLLVFPLSTTWHFGLSLAKRINPIWVLNTCCVQMLLTCVKTSPEVAALFQQQRRQQRELMKALQQQQQQQQQQKLSGWGNVSKPAGTTKSLLEIQQEEARQMQKQQQQQQQQQQQHQQSNRARNSTVGFFS